MSNEARVAVWKRGTDDQEPVFSVRVQSDAPDYDEEVRVARYTPYITFPEKPNDPKALNAIHLRLPPSWEQHMIDNWAEQIGRLAASAYYEGVGRTQYRVNSVLGLLK